jgi:hypothetical protein
MHASRAWADDGQSQFARASRIFQVNRNCLRTAGGYVLGLRLFRQCFQGMNGKEDMFGQNSPEMCLSYASTFGFL